jgi:beta-glucosidase
MEDGLSTTPATSPAFGALETRDAITPARIDERARALLSELTLEEKLSLMDGDDPFWSGLNVMMRPGGYSSRVWVAGAVPRLGIPGVRFADGPRGIVMEGATTFPVSMARGASWDPELEERVGDVIGRELRALGGNLFGGVCINLLRHPAWGRAQETYGEDTFHVGEFGAALTRGVQRHVMACVKHYALNSMENARFKLDVEIGPRALREVYLPHFKRCVDAGAASVMSAYNSVNGEWAGQNRELLQDILKDDWGFQGYVLTDFIFGMRDPKTAALAGQDLEMPFSFLYHRSLPELVDGGEVPLERIDDAALRILRQQVRFAQGRDPAGYGPEVVGSEAHRRLAREAAQKSIVLLKNEGGLLPLEAAKRFAVIGALAATPNTGDGGSSNTRPAYVVTPLEGLRAALGERADLVYDDGSDPARAARVAADADTVVLVVGYTHADEGEFIPPDMLSMFAPSFPPPGPEEEAFAGTLTREIETQEGGFSPGGDRDSLALHEHDETLIHAVAAANPRTVVAVMAGSAVITEAWRKRVPAILMLWYPGMEGGNAFADVLLGRVNPGGRLPCTFPRRAADLPYFDKKATRISYDLWHGYRKLARDGRKAAFPLGYGLGYTDFEYSNLRLVRSELGEAGTLVAHVDVTNTGPRAGDEVVQLYVGARHSRVERAPHELKAFRRVSIEAGQTRSVRLELPVRELAYFEDGGWVVEPTTYQVVVGRHAEDAGLSGSFTVS